MDNIIVSNLQSDDNAWEGLKNQSLKIEDVWKEVYLLNQKMKNDLHKCGEWCGSMINPELTYNNINRAVRYIKTNVTLCTNVIVEFFEPIINHHPFNLEKFVNNKNFRHIKFTVECVYKETILTAAVKNIIIEPDGFVTYEGLTRTHRLSKVKAPADFTEFVSALEMSANSFISHYINALIDSDIPDGSCSAKFDIIAHYRNENASTNHTRITFSDGKQHWFPSEILCDGYEDTPT